MFVSNEKVNIFSFFNIMFVDLLEQPDRDNPHHLGVRGDPLGKVNSGMFYICTWFD
jgi:hypothetical protein